MRKYLLLSIGVVSLAVIGQAFVLGTTAQDNKPAPPKIAASRLIKVTVYPNSALVTREVKVPAGEGLTELVVSPLPVQIVDNSLYSEGTEKLRILSTRFRTRQVLEDTREDVRKAQDEIKKLAREAEKMQTDIQSITTNMMMLTKLEQFTAVTTVKATANGGLNVDQVLNLSKYVMDQRAEQSKSLVDLKQQLQDNQEKANYVRRKLSEITSGSNKMERDAVIVVDRRGGNGGLVRLNYLVNSVSWRPQYKLRCGENGEDVQVDYLAALMQQSGEDWNGVNVTLSTAQPMLNAAPPELAKLEITVVDRASLARGPATGRPGFSRTGQTAGGGQAGAFLQEKKKLAADAVRLQDEAIKSLNRLEITKAGKELNQAAAARQNSELMMTKKEIVLAQKLLTRMPTQPNEGPSVTYQLGHRLTVPSRNDEQVVEMAKLSFTPSFYYKAVPVLTRNVYRLADMTNKSQQVLLPGEATMYQGTDFVGRMTMPLVAIGEQFTVGFGVDPQLQIQREMMDKNRTTQGGNQVLTYDYRILVSSYKKHPVKVQVWDRLPSAEMETAGITLVKTSPEISNDPLYQRESRPSNLLRWDLDVNPGTTGEKALTINYTFRLDLDREMIINRLFSR